MIADGLGFREEGRWGKSAGEELRKGQRTAGEWEVSIGEGKGGNAK